MQHATPQSSSRQGGSFDMDVGAIRAKARQDIESGAVTEGYRADRQAVLKLLNEALAPKWSVCCATSATISWPAA